MKKISIYTFLLSLSFVSNASAIEWTNAGEDLSSVNAQITCDGSNNCSLSTISGTEINLGEDEFYINNPTNVSSFTIDSGDESNPYSIVRSGGGANDSALDISLSGLSLNNLSIVSNITNNGDGYGLYLNRGTFSGAIDIKADVLAKNESIVLQSVMADSFNYTALDSGITSTGGKGLQLSAVNITGALSVTSNISTTKDYGFYLNGGNFGSVTYDGDIDSGHRGLVLDRVTRIAGDVNVSGSVTSLDREAIYIYNTTIDGNVNISSDLTSNYKDVLSIRDTSIGGQLKLSGNIAGDVYIWNGSRILEGVLIGTGSNIGGKVINKDSNLLSSTGAAITFEDLAADNTLTYSGTGTLSGSTYDIDMGSGHDTLNLTEKFTWGFTHNGIEEFNIYDAVAYTSLTVSNDTNPIMGNTGFNNVENTIFRLSTTDAVLTGDSDSQFIIANLSPGSTIDTSTIGVALLGTDSNYGGFVYRVGDQLVMEYGQRNLDFSGTDASSMDLAITCSGGVCDTNLTGNAISGGNSGSKIQIHDIAAASGIDTLYIGGNDSNPESQIRFNYYEETIENYISISNENNLDIINNADIYHLGNYASHMISFSASSVLNGDFINNGDITTEGNAIYAENSTLNGNLTNNGNLGGGSDLIYFRNFAINGDLTNNGIINANATGINLSSGSSINNFSNTGTIISTSRTGDGVYMDGITISNMFENTGTISSLRYGVQLKNINDGFKGVLNSGTIEATTTKSGDTNTALYVGYSNIDGNIENTSTGIIRNESEKYSGAIFLDETNLNDVLNAGEITSKGDAIKLISWGGSHTLNQINNSGDISGLNRGIHSFGYNITGGIINSGNITAGSEDVEYAGKKNTVAIHFLESDIGTLENTETGVISGQIGISFGAQHTNGDQTGKDIIDTDLTVINNGLIEGTSYAAIEMDYGSIHGEAESFDNTLNYSGNGVLSGTTYDIDMGEGNDIVNITNATMEFPIIKGGETVNISDSTIGLTLNSENLSSPLMTTNETTLLTLSNVNFELTVDSSASSSVESLEYIILSEVELGDTDISTLSLDLLGVDREGELSIVDNEGVDQLIYKFLVEAPATSPAQGGVLSLAPSNAVFQSSVTSAASASSAVLDVVQGRQMARRYKDVLSENSELASIDAAIMSDVDNLFGIDNKKEGVWVQISSQKDSYDGETKSGGSTLSSSGYDADSFGITVGYDQKLSNELLAGVSLTYSTGDAEGDGNSFETDMETIQLSLYSSYLMDDRTFLDTVLGYGIGSYDQKRNAGSDIAKADYDSSQISAMAKLGKIYTYRDRMVFAPFAKASYVHVNQDGYDEKGSSSNLSVESISFNSFQASLGMEYGYVFHLDNYETLMPTAKLEFARELNDNAFAIHTTNAGTGLAGTSYLSPDMGRSIIRMGAGITYLNEKGHELSFDYEIENRDNFDSDTLYLKGKYMF